ncbi:MAG: HAMP domain-containing histidine kinase [Candidatus Heimdallarchaeota archaeon]|nr:MAG: HAMP domain-containing histidine kinase [Candidatus Heimdallarchaeota archaeon]
MENIGKNIRVFCLYEKQHELESFLNTALAQTQVQRYLISFSTSTKSSSKLYLSVKNGFKTIIIKVPAKISEKWKKSVFLTNLDDFLGDFSEYSTRQNFFLDFTALKVTTSFVKFVESSLEDKISDHEFSYSIFSLFLEKNLSKRVLTQLAFKYPFLCLTDSHIHPNFYYEAEKGGKFPNTLRDLYQPIQLLLEELEKDSLEHDRLNKELFMLSTHSNVLETSLATFLEMERDRIGSERKSVPADLISLSDYRNLKQRYDEKTQMLSAVSHDLKSPIAAIQGFAEILRDGLAGEVTQEMKKHLEMIVSNSKRLSRMVESIMEMESLDRSDYIDEKQTFDLVEMIDDAKMSVLPQMIQKDLEIQTYTPDSLEMVGNRELLLRALQNILDNAVKYSPPKKGQIELFTEEQDLKGHKVIKITVKDNGFGFNKKNLKRVFEPFTKFEPGSTSTGLGLSIVKKIVESIHDGTIEITSPGRKKGTTVTIFLPKT